MPTVIALKDIHTVYGLKKEGEAFQASPRQARILEEEGSVQIVEANNVTVIKEEKVEVPENPQDFVDDHD